MLKAVSGEIVEVVPHSDDYKLSRMRITDVEFLKLKEALVSKISSRRFHNSLWFGHDFLSKSEHKELFLKAADGQVKDVGRLFGLYLFTEFFEHKDMWIFKSLSSRGVPGTGGIEYFRSNADLKAKYLDTNMRSSI